MKKLRRGGAMLLSFVLTLSLAAGTFLIYVAADAANGWLNATLGELSQKYETGTNDDPGMIATVNGDAGGKSYGLYMFASKAGTPKLFFQWCIASDNRVYNDMGDTLKEAYYLGGEGCGSNFDNAWTYLANVYGDTFGDAQKDFVEETIYEATVAKVEAAVSGFDIDNYSIALQNVFWSRAVQHGVSGGTNMIVKAFNAMGGFKNQGESEVIAAIYNESGKLTTDSAPRMSGTSADKYGVSGKSMAYFTGCSGAVQLGVYVRLNINEPADAQMMLYNNTNPPVDEGVYRLSSGTDLYLGRSDSNALTMNTSGMDLKLTYFASDYYTLTVDETELRLAMADGKPVLQNASAGKNQMWELENVNGGYTLKNRSTGTYLTGSLTATDDPDKATAWRLSPAGNGWLTSGMFYPSEDNTLLAGSSAFPIRGTIRSNLPITGVTVAVLNSSGKAVTSASARPNATRYDLKNLDDSIKFSKLTAGDYTYVVTATNSAGTVTLVESDFTVYQPTNITVTFNANGGTLTSGSATMTVAVGSTYGSLPVAKKDGAEFLGWFNESGEQVTDSTTVPDSATGKQTLTARYSGAYTYAFQDKDGKTVASGSLAPGKLIPTPSSPASYSDGTYVYTFKRWISDIGVFETGVTVMPESNVVFKAEYSSKKLSGGGGSGGGGGGGETTVGGGDTLDAIVPGVDAASYAASMGATLYASDGVTAVTSGKVATGMVAYIGGSSYVVVVTGDTNGDGKLTITDVVKLQAHVVGRTSLSGAYAAAGDLNGDGKISITDVVQAAQVTVNKRTIG